MDRGAGRPTLGRHRRPRSRRLVQPPHRPHFGVSSHRNLRRRAPARRPHRSCGAVERLTAAAAAVAMINTRDDAIRLRVCVEFTRGADEIGTAALPLVAAEPMSPPDHHQHGSLGARRAMLPRHTNTAAFQGVSRRPIRPVATAGPEWLLILGVGRPRAGWHPMLQRSPARREYEPPVTIYPLSPSRRCRR